MAGTDVEIIFLKECDLSGRQFTDQEIEDYAAKIGIDLEYDRDLFWLAEQGMREQLPEGWVPAEAVGEGVFFYNKETQCSCWEHPCDLRYKGLVEIANATRSSMVVNLVVARAEGCTLTVEAWNLAGERLATCQASEHMRFRDLREQLARKITVPGGSVLRLLRDATMLGHSHEAHSVGEVLAPQ